MTEQRPGTALPTRDHLTAGLVLLRALLPTEATPAVLDFHAEVVRPLLDDTTPESADLMRWARALGAAEVLSEAVETKAPGWAVVSDDVRLDLLDLAERIGAATGAPSAPDDDDPQVLVEAPDGRCVPLTLRPSVDHAWHAVRSDVAETDVETALARLLRQFPGTWPAAWPEPDDLPTTVWWPTGVPLDAAATTLPVVLWHLGRITGLGAPPVLSAGEVVDKQYVRLEGEKLAARVAAAKAAGRSLLAPTATGWTLTPPGGKPTEVDGPLTLDGAATAVWGPAWQRWKRERHADELAALGWRVEDWRTPPAGQPLPDLDVTQSRQLTEYFLKNRDRAVAVLGGTQRSGKSTTVRRMAADLGGKKKAWQVLVLVGPEEKLPDRHVATAAGRHALGASGEESARRLLVFERIRPSDDDDQTDVGELMEHVSQQLHTAVLTVLEHNENSPTDWQLGNVYVVTSAVNARMRTRFVEDLVRADPALEPRAARATAACRAITDLRRITQLLALEGDPAVRVAARFAELADSEREPLVRAAAMSLIGGVVDAESLEVLELSDAELFGVVEGHAPKTSWLCGMDDCLSLVDLYAEARYPKSATAGRSRVEIRNEVIADLVEPELSRELNDHSGRVPARFAGARLFHRRLAENLVKRTAGELVGEWAIGAPATSVVEMLGLGELLDTKTVQGLAKELVRRLPHESSEWQPSRLVALVHALQDIESDVPADVMESFTSWLVGVVDYLIHRRAGTPEERFALLAALERSDGDGVKTMLVDRVLDVLDGLQVDQVSSYRLVRQVEEMQRRLEWGTSTDPSWFVVDQEHAVQELLKHEPHENDGIGVLIESMRLRQQFEYVDWQIRVEPYEPHLTAAMRFTTAAELARAVNDLHTSMPLFSTWLLGNWKDFTERARTLLRKSAPTEAAMLVNAVARANALKIPSILYRPNGTVDYGLVEAFASRIRPVEDATGAGLLLLAVHSAGELFHTGQDLFGTELAEEIGEDKVRTMIEYDPRPSTRYYLVKGVWDAGASYRERVLDSALDVVVEGVVRRRKHWGAELALHLATDPELGTTALDELRRRLTSTVLVRSMSTAHTAQARAVFHRLGRMLHPDVPDLYKRQWEQDSFIEGLSKSPVAALEVCAEVAKTLTEADVPDAGPMILKAGGGADYWANRLASGRRSAGAFAQALGHITALDPDGARKVVEKLHARESQVRVRTKHISSLAAWLRKAMLHDTTAATTLIEAIERVKPGTGAAVLAELAEDRHAAHVFRNDLQHLQDPVAQSTSARTLVRIGVTKGTENSSWIDSLYRARIQTMDQFTGPRAAAALLRMMSAWDPQWGATATRQINTSRIGRRIAVGRITDLPPAIDLIRTLCALDDVGRAQQLAEKLATADPGSIGRHLGLDALCRLVDIMREVAPDTVPRLMRGMQDVVDATIRTPLILDEGKVWRQIGRAQATLRRLGSPPLLVSEVSIRPNPAHAPAVAWAAVELGTPEWGDNALDRMRSVLRDRKLSDAVDHGCVLMATARGWAPELRAEDRTWDVARAPLWMLRLLYHEAPTDHYLSAVLKAAEPDIRKRLSRATARADWDADRLRVVLNAGVRVRSPKDVARRMLESPDDRPADNS